jgi:septal ring factor EnvC (AmiA/AmiB activator)
MSPELVGQIFTIGLGIGVLLAGILTGLNQRKMKSQITQHVEATSTELAAIQTKLDQKNQQLIDMQLESRYNAGKYDASIALVAQTQKDIIELKQHEADLARLLKQAYAQIASMKATHEAERRGYQTQIVELQRRIGELESERKSNREEISKLSQMLTNALVKGAAPAGRANGKVNQPVATPAPKPPPSKRKVKAMV